MKHIELLCHLGLYAESVSKDINVA